MARRDRAPHRSAGRDASPSAGRDFTRRAAARAPGADRRARRPASCRAIAQLAERGQCELSVTPYGHPIVPLLLDFQAARDAVPAMPLPQHAGYPGGAARAQWHVRGGASASSSRRSARARAGCWPAEGAISGATLRAARPRAAFAGRRPAPMCCSGSLALARPPGRPRSARLQPSLPPAGGTGSSCFFRDDTLSDLIGFTYATWHGDDAAHNLVNELRSQAAPSGATSARPGNHAVLIALDGENAWEHYPFNGYYFLRALYALLAAHPLLELTTLSRVPGARHRSRRRCRSVVRRQLGAWHARHLDGRSGQESRLGSAVRCQGGLRRRHARARLDAAQRAAAGRQLALCESSDWFWWFGDYNPADAVSQFDRLYRRQLVTLYRRLDLRAARQSWRSRSPSATATPEHGGVMRRASAERVRVCAGDARGCEMRLPVFDRRRAGVLLPMSALEARARARRPRASSTGWRSAGFSRLADPAGRARRAPTARPTGCARTSPATRRFSIPPSCPTRMRRASPPLSR